MTEQQRKPTNRDIQAAIDSLAAAYHEFAQALLAREDAERSERRYLRERLDVIAGILDRLQQQMDRRFDQVWREVDAIRLRMDAFEAHIDASDQARPREP